MAKKTPIEKLDASIMKILNDYTEGVIKTSAEVTKKAGQAGARALRQASPKKTGEYAKGWTSRIEGDRVHTVAVIYNSTKPGLAHLLEHGHVTKNGTGRTYDRTPAHVHIAPIEQKLVENFANQIKVEISR